MTQGTAGRLEERHDRYIELIKQFTIMNDIFMRNVLKEKACTEFILQIITENIGLRIVEQVLQMDYANLHGRAARLDCVALDTANKVYNLEIQQENEGALPKRPRYHASLLDANILEPGTEFQNLPCTTVIFITNLVTDDEMELFLSHLDKRRDILLYKMLYLTGARIQEVLDLEIDSVPLPDMGMYGI